MGFRIKDLKRISAAMPTQNQAMVNQQNQAAQVQAQANLAAAQPMQTSARTVQQFAGQTAGTMGQNTVKAAENTATGNAKTQAQALVEQGIAQTKAVGSRGDRLDKERLANEQKLFNLSFKAKDDIYNQRYKLDENKINQGYMNNIQLLDWAATQAQSDEQFKQYVQQIQQDTDRANQFQMNVYERINQDLDQQWKLADQKQDQVAKRNIENIKKDLAERSAKAARDSANTKAVISAVGTIAGAAAKGAA